MLEGLLELFAELVFELIVAFGHNLAHGRISIASPEEPVEP